MYQTDIGLSDHFLSTLVASCRKRILRSPNFIWVIFWLGNRRYPIFWNKDGETKDQNPNLCSASQDHRQPLFTTLVHHAVRKGVAEPRIRTQTFALQAKTIGSLSLTLVHHAVRKGVAALKMGKNDIFRYKFPTRVVATLPLNPQKKIYAAQGELRYGWFWRLT